MDTDIKSLSDSGLLSLATGFLLPPFVAVLQQPRWPVWLRASLTAVICVGSGYLEARLMGTLDTRDLLRAVLITLIAANSTYRGFWKPVGISGTIEEATNVQPVGGAIAGFFADRTRKSEEDKMIVAQTARDRADVLARAKAALIAQDAQRKADAAQAAMPIVLVPTMPVVLTQVSQNTKVTEGIPQWHNPTNIS